MFILPSLFYSSRQKQIAAFLLLHFNIRPKHIDIYEKALIHGSNDPHLDSTFERLEFLGDGVLDLIIRDILFNRYPHLREGDLTKMKSSLVNRKNLSVWAKNIKIESILQADYSSMSRHEYVFGNALETIIGAIYQDLGYQKTNKALTHFLKHRLASHTLEEDQNYKGLLIEWAQKNKKNWNFETIPLPQNGQFQSSVIIQGDTIASGKGNSKKDAEQDAAREAYKKLI